MRLFDIVGLLAVTLWIGVMGYFALEQWTDGSASLRVGSDEVVLKEGETWLTMQRHEVEVGYVHEVRTRLPDGWLIEYTMVMNLEVMSFQQLIQTNIKSTMDNDGILRQFSAEITAMNQTFRALGEASNEELRVSVFAAGLPPIKRTIALDTPPRLAVNAVNQFLASPDLQPGARLRQPFFDPATMQMTTLEYEYIGPEEIEHLEVMYSAHRFHQHIGNQTLETIVDTEGEVLIQTFPMRILGYRIPAEFARAQVASWNRKVREENRSAPAVEAPLDAEAAMNLLEQLRPRNLPIPGVEPVSDEEAPDEEVLAEDPQPTETHTP